MSMTGCRLLRVVIIVTACAWCNSPTLASSSNKWSVWAAGGYSAGLSSDRIGHGYDVQTGVYFAVSRSESVGILASLQPDGKFHDWKPAPSSTRSMTMTVNMCHVDSRGSAAEFGLGLLRLSEHRYSVTKPIWSMSLGVRLWSFHSHSGELRARLDYTRVLNRSEGKFRVLAGLQFYL